MSTRNAYTSTLHFTVHTHFVRFVVTTGFLVLTTAEQVIITDGQFNYNHHRLANQKRFTCQSYI